VLDKYKEPMKENIKTAASLEELLDLYEKEHKTKRSPVHDTTAPTVASDPFYGPSAAPTPYSPAASAEMNLEQAITEWENSSGLIRLMRRNWEFFGWVASNCCLEVGMLGKCYR
jgi:hypothetical protein